MSEGEILAMPKTKDALKILYRLTGNEPQLRERIERETINTQVAQLIYDARTKAGLTQKQLAGLLGTSQPNIARWEDSGYERHER
jgi:ribosome-binding protein aMBF1 (putative translation factor)